MPATKLARAEKLQDYDLRSYWVGKKAELASEAFSNGDYPAAKAGFTELLAESEAAADKRRIHLMLALCESKLGNYATAAKELMQLQTELPELADYLRWHSARSYFFAGKTEEALKQAENISTDSVHKADAEMLVGNILRGQKKWQAAEEVFSGYIDNPERKNRKAEAKLRLATSLKAQGKAAEAASLFKELSVAHPLSGLGTQAQELLGSTLPSLPRKERSRLQSLSAADFITRGMVYYRKNRNEKSEAEFAAALGASPTTKERCVAAYHQANSVYKQRNREKAAPLFVAALSHCEKAGNADLYVKAAYQGGRSFATLGQREKAIEFYRLIEEKHPEHSYADDARLLQAEEYEKIGKGKKADELLSSIAETYPKGDMGGEALWRLAWRAYKAKNYSQTIKWLEKHIVTTPVDDRFWAEGQAEYWIARSQGKLGNKKKSEESYGALIAKYPLSYYSLLALNRLREASPTLFASTVASMQTPPKAEGSESGAFNFKDRPEYKSPAFARAVEFLRMGLSRPAAAELSRLGFHLPAGRERLTDSDKIDRAWAYSYLQNQLGNYGKGLWATRWHALDYKRHWPEGAWRKRWEIAYPPGYADLIQKYSQENDVPFELIIAFVREESGFDPRQESFANAIGLSQLIIPTAKRFAKGTGIVVNRESLQNPDKNLRIGSTFMSFLLKKWDGQISLVAPSYNAGEGAVARWMRERGNWPRDEWAEEIPYDETRRYSKRVISSYFTYLYLKDRQIPEFPNESQR